MKQLIVILSVALTACTTVPVKRSFPEVPRELLTTCADLKTVPEGTTKLSDVLTVVTDNYTIYQECAVQNDAWIEWYRDQKRIFESVK